MFAILLSVFPRTSSFAPGNFCWKLTTQKMQMPCVLCPFFGNLSLWWRFSKRSLRHFSQTTRKITPYLFWFFEFRTFFSFWCWLPVFKSLDIWNLIVRIRFYVPNLKLRRKLQFGRGAIILWGKFCKDKSKSKTFRKFKDNW